MTMPKDFPGSISETARVLNATRQWDWLALHNLELALDQNDVASAKWWLKQAFASAEGMAIILADAEETRKRVNRELRQKLRNEISDHQERLNENGETVLAEIGLRLAKS
jgi:hypothetical protein